jgi:two-component system NtrC family sensor kinase
MRKLFIVCFIIISSLSKAGAKEKFHLETCYNCTKKDLLLELNKAKSDTERIIVLHNLINCFENNNNDPQNLDTSYFNQLIKINERLNLINDQPYRTFRLALRAGKNKQFLDELSLMEKAVEEFDSEDIDVVSLLAEMRWVFNIVNKQEDKFKYYSKKLSGYLQQAKYHNAATCYHCIAGYYVFKGDFNSSINNYLKAAELYKSFSNFWYIDEFLVVGNRYHEWGNSNKGLFYLKKGLNLVKGADQNLYYGLLSLSKIEYDLHQYDESLHNLDKLFKSLTESETMQKMEYDTDIQILRALDYIELNRVHEAYKYLQLAKTLGTRTGISRLSNNGEYGLNYGFYKYYRALNENSKAEAFLLQTYHQAAMDANVEDKIKYLKELAAFYSRLKNIDKAWNYTVLYNRISDSLQTKTNVFKIASYESEQKENEQNKKLASLREQRAIQDAVIGKRNVIILISFIGLVAVCGLVIFVYRQLHINKKTLLSLKQTQTQLIQSEKMASLGELTAGIAHEIQNPLNFVNNFSEVNTELIDEMQAEIDKGNLSEVKAIAVDLKENEQKINMHGKRADSIVKSMLEHSRASSGQKESTDLNALADEYMRLSYHGLRAKDKSFNSAMDTHLDNTLPKVNAVPQDIGRVLLNLFNNAFYAVHQKKKQNPEGYLPQVTLTTSKKDGFIEIAVKDNGNGIPENIKDKIMQPFFTTKPTGEGTGLGLSLSYDIVVKGHGGSIFAGSTEGQGSEFIIKLPLNKIKEA